MNKIKEIKKLLDIELQTAPEETRALYASVALYTLGNYVIYDFAYEWTNFWQLLSGLLMCFIAVTATVIILDERSNEYEDEEL